MAIRLRLLPRVDGVKRIFRSAEDWCYELPAPPILRSLGGLAYRIVSSFLRDDGAHMAAGMAYYAMFSLFPLLLGTIAIASFFFTSAEAQERLFSLMDQAVPGLGQNEVLQQNVRDIVRARGTVGIVSIITLLFSGRIIFSALHRVMNRAWKVTDRPHFLIQQLIQIGAAMALISLFLITMVLSTTLRVLAGDIEFLQSGEFLLIPWQAFLGFIPFIFSVLIFLLLYRFLPDTHVAWEHALSGAMFAGFAFEVSKFGFVFYLNNVASFEQVYGGVSSFIVLLLWLYVVSMILVIGAEIASEYAQSRKSGLLQFRGHFKPVRGGLAPLSRRNGRNRVRQSSGESEAKP